ncbi:MAG: hypothetical protein RLZ37_2124 [Actinomycetota bacterium]|jgi:hypothetical protein
MMKRLTWFVTGLVAGAGSVILIGRRIKRRVADLAPVRVAERVLGRSRGSVDRLRDAIMDGRSAAARRETDLRHRFLDESPRETSPESRAIEFRR